MNEEGKRIEAEVQARHEQVRFIALEVEVMAACRRWGIPGCTATDVREGVTGDDIGIKENMPWQRQSMHND